MPALVYILTELTIFETVLQKKLNKNLFHLIIQLFSKSYNKHDFLNQYFTVKLNVFLFVENKFQTWIAFINTIKNQCHIILCQNSYIFFYYGYLHIVLHTYMCIWMVDVCIHTLSLYSSIYMPVKLIIKFSKDLSH